MSTLTESDFGSDVLPKHPIAQAGTSLFLFGFAYAVVEYYSYIFERSPVQSIRDWIIGNAIMHTFIAIYGIVLWAISGYGGIESIVQILSFFLFKLPVLIIVALWAWGLYLVIHNKYYDFELDNFDEVLLMTETMVNGVLILIWVVLQLVVISASDAVKREDHSSVSWRGAHPFVNREEALQEEKTVPKD